MTGPTLTLTDDERGLLDGLDAAARAHPLVRDAAGTLRFRPNRLVAFLVEECRWDLNRIWPLHGRGDWSEDELRAVYRDMGYSVFGYWEVFVFSQGEDEDGEAPP